MFLHTIVTAYGISYNPNYWNYNWNKPTGWGWESYEESSNDAYPIHYWGYYSPSWQWGNYAPPEGLSGYYNICLDYAYSYRTSPGDASRLTMPVVDLSGLGNVTGMKMYIDVFHNRADNYQDRIEIVARTGSDPSDLGEYIRESGTPSFDSGTITGADNGVEIGGNYAAATFNDVTVNSPNNAGFAVVGSTSASVTDLTVAGGNYGILAAAGASGLADFENVDISGTSSAGAYYVKDLRGELSGTIASSTGAGIKFGSATSNDITWNGLTLGTNSIGVETAGKGTLTFIDSNFGNTKDAVISGTATIDFIEGDVDATTVQVTRHWCIQQNASLGCHTNC